LERDGAVAAFRAAVDWAVPGVPFERLMSYVDVFVTHGGHGGVQLALAHRVPIVAAGRTQETSR
jgi:UDP:flavonoid glycosyltransferase YjiC (YdhE family)